MIENFNKIINNKSFEKVRFLESITLSKSKIWKSKKCIEVNTFDNVSKIIDNLKD